MHMNKFALLMLLQYNNTHPPTTDFPIFRFIVSHIFCFVVAHSNLHPHKTNTHAQFTVFLFNVLSLLTVTDILIKAKKLSFPKIELSFAIKIYIAVMTYSTEEGFHELHIINLQQI